MSKRLGFLFIALITAFIGYNLVVQIFSTLKSADKLETASSDLSQLESMNKSLQKQLSEVKSPEYIEKEARDKLGLAKDGETIVVIPNDKITQVLGVAQVSDNNRDPNWLGWWKVFF